MARPNHCQLFIWNKSFDGTRYIVFSVSLNQNFYEYIVGGARFEWSDKSGICAKMFGLAINTGQMLTCY